MQRRLAKQFHSWCFGMAFLALVCVSYIYSSPSPVSIASLESAEVEQLAVASQPSRLAFISFSADSTIRAFWKSPEDSTHKMTIVIDPVDESPEEITTDESDAEDTEAPDAVDPS